MPILALLTPLFRVAARVLWKFHVHGADRVPAAGPVLLAGNHVSYLDWLALWAACPRRLTFVMWAGHANKWWLRPFLWFARNRLIVVPHGGPHATADALDQIANALALGDAVAIFPEGRVTRNGQMGPFGRGFERAVERAGVPVSVVPFHLDNLWGSAWSYEGGRLFGQWPTGRRRVAVYFGEPLLGPASAPEVRAAVVEAGAECGIRESDHLLTPIRRFIRLASRWRSLRAPAFVDVSTGVEKKLTWPKALVGAWCLSGWLGKKLAPGEQTVGIWLPTGLGSALANLALGLLGRTTVNLNYTAGPAPVLAAARAAGLKHVVTSRKFLERIKLDLPDDIERLYLEDAMGSITGRGRLVRFLAVVFFPAWLLERLIGVPARALDDVLTIIFSSGSTGDPKGVMLTHRNIAANTDSFVRGVEMHPSDRMLATLPIFHSFGYTVCLWAPCVVGMEAVFFPDPRAAQEVGELCRKHRCTIMMGTATFLRFYLRRSGADDFKSLRLLICGAEKLPVNVTREFHAKFGVEPLEGYGCTETSPVVSTNLHDATVAGVTQKANTLGTVGQPIPNVAVKAFDPDTRRPLPPGVDGVLGVRGANVMAGYLHDPERTAKVMAGGWYLTGDVGRIEDDGFIRITGRLSRFAKIAGEMVPVERIEEDLHELLVANGERLLAVAAVPCDRRGERLLVLHLPNVRDRLSAAFEGLRAKGLPNLWVPDVRDCHPIDSFPALATGKLDLRGLGELARKVAAAPHCLTADAAGR